MEGGTKFLKIQKYKSIVKRWESDFTKLHGSKPSKNDIKEAPPNIKAAYKRYWTLKSNELEKSFLDAGFDDSTFDDFAIPDQFSNENMELPKTISEKSATDFENSKEPPKAGSSDCKKVSAEQLETKGDASTSDSVPERNIKKNSLNETNFEKSVVQENLKENSLNDANFEKSDPLTAPSQEKCDIPENNDKSDAKGVPEVEDLKKLNDSGWGTHLNKSAVQLKKAKPLTKSVSSHFLEKLFVGSKFKKKNPRKIKSFSRIASLKKDDLPNISQSSTSRDDGFPVDTIKSSKQKPDFEKEISDSNVKLVTEELNILEDEVMPFNSVISNLSINIKKTNVEFNNVSKSVKSDPILSTGVNSKKLDKGWVERCNQRNCVELAKQSSFDSGIDLSDSSGNTSTRNSSLNTFESSSFLPEDSIVDAPQNDIFSQDNSSSEDDFVFDSDSEGERSRSNFMFTSRSSSSKLSISSHDKVVETNSFCSNKSPPPKDVRHFPIDSLKDDAPEKVDTESSKVSDSVENPSETHPVGRKRLRSNDSSFLENRLFKRPKESDPSDHLVKLPSFDNAKTVKKSKVKESSISFNDQRKVEILKKKLASGKANENYVGINIQKKVFVRGKKTMTNSKYKRQQWKAKKKLQNYTSGKSMTSDGDLQTCFKCNEIGHWARDCCQGEVLLPKEADDDELDCPFPTLEEAEDIAGEMKESAHLKKNQQKAHRNKLVNPVDDGMNLDVPQCEDLIENFSQVEPLFETNEDGSLIDTPLSVYNALLDFNHKQFRPGQEEAMMRILSGKSTLVTLSTGAGKSLIYQLPAHLYAQRSNCITLVVSPLISLMEDQIFRIPPFLKAACLHTNQSESQKNKILDNLKNGDVNVLLISPEAVVAGDRMGNKSFLRLLPPIAFACIDEAHCVSMWSHNFRPSYLMICRVLRERMGVKTILGLTASATQLTIDSIISHLGITDGTSGVIKDVPLPDNLILSVSRDERRDSALLKLLKGPRFSSFNCIIVYCTRRDECERLAAYLRTTLKDDLKPSLDKPKSSLSCIAEPYHAGLSSGRRRQVQNGFMKGYVRIVVATVAFGMGINKSDIRGIIHYNMPARCENYVQEVGRAGRDGLPAHCHLFLSSMQSDLNELRRHIYANSIARHTLRKLLEKVFVPCKCPKQLTVNAADAVIAPCEKHERAFDIEEIVSQLDVPQENIMTLLCYLEAHPKKWIDILPNSYTVCKVNVYSGEMQLRRACKTCPPLAVAVAEERKKMSPNVRNFEFPVVSLAASIGWDSGIVKHVLNKVMWTEVKGKPKKAGINIEFTNLGFRVLSPGNLPPDELDEALDSLHRQVEHHEQTSLRQLQFLFQCLTEISSESCNDCVEEVDPEKSDQLKRNIRAYFADESVAHSIGKIELIGLKNEGQVIFDIRNLIETHRDSTFTGLAIARIFHGISSPNYPAITWGRTKYWRAHLHEDFKSVAQFATVELIKFR